MLGVDPEGWLAASHAGGSGPLIARSLFGVRYQFNRSAHVPSTMSIALFLPFGRQRTLSCSSQISQSPKLGHAREEGVHLDIEE